MSERAAKETGAPTAWDSAFREGRAKGLEEAAGMPYRDAWLHAATTTQNDRGDWVPAIPLPFYGLRKRCDCGQRFWTAAGYRGHYALVHILGLC
jgi:hypothetical protein